MTLSTRLTLAMMGLVLLTALAVGWLSYRNLEGAALSRAMDRVETRARASAADIEKHVRGARGDVHGFRSAVALEGMVRAHFAGGRDPVDGTSEQTWRERMAARYVAELTWKAAYTEFRIITIADGGSEILRVDRFGPGGSVRVVPAAELQRKGDRAFFREAVKLKPDEVYVSEVDLSRDDDVIHAPHIPTARVAAIIEAPDKTPFGLVVINVDMRPVFDEIRDESRPSSQLYVINGRGDYLSHPDTSREFGFELGKSFRLQDDFPELASAVPGNSGSFVVTEPSGERSAVGVGWVRLGDGPLVGVVEIVSNAVIMGPAAAVRRSTLLVGATAVLCAALLAFLLARSLTRPLVQMTRALEGFGGDHPVAVPTDARGEIGVLARAFARMMAEVKDKTAALLESEKMAGRIIETALDAFVQMDDAGVVIDWNGQAERIFGWSREEAVGRALVDLIVPEAHRRAHSDGLARFLRTGESPILGRRLEIEALRRDGREITVELSVTALARRGHYVFNGFIRDLTDKRTAEEQLRQSQKMESVGQLTGGIAHDFNNILTVITGTIDILADAVADRPQLAAIARMIDDAAERGANLTRHLLAFARKQPLQPRDTDINALVVDVAKLLRPTLGEQIEIESMLEDDAWKALVDPNQLATAIINLSINARDAMPSGGRLTLETGNVYLDEGYTSMHGGDVAPSPYVMIAVSDTGCGIPAAIIDKVFEPFFTTKGTGKGTGLGLSMVYGFVKQSAGHIKIYSEEGHGTTIKVYLPRAAADSTQAVEAPPAAPVNGGQETILVVEDDDLVRHYVVAQIQSLGYTALAAANAAEALRLIEEGASLDLLFTDVIMPGPMNGRQLADEAQRRRPALKVLFTSGYTENAIVHHGRLDPGVLLLAKPYRKSDLARMIRVALESPRYAGAEVAAAAQ